MKTPEPLLPEGLRFGYQFALLNAITFQIASGTPIILYAKSLGATSTVLGIIASLLPLFTVLQLPAASYLPKFGYRKFMMGGWGLRTIFIFLISTVPMLGFADRATKISLILFFLFVYSVLRGISSGAWMPWITELVPPNRRGLYLSREQLAVHAGSLLALGICAITLRVLPEPWRYSTIFFLSGCTGVISLSALRRIPDVPPSEKARSSAHPVPWGAIIKYPPFQKLLLLNILWSIIAGTLPVFSVAFSREMLGFSDSRILWISLFGFGSALLTLPISARFLDLIGSKKILRGVCVLAALMTLGWCLLAAGFWNGKSMFTVCLLNFLFGVANANYAVANARLSMAVMPAMGRNHFFALFTVVISLAAGAAPIICGIGLDAMTQIQGQMGGALINRYSLYFLGSATILAVACLCVSLLEEGQLGKLTRRDYAILIGLRRFGRLFQR